MSAAAQPAAAPSGVARVTVAVIPRDRFAFACKSLQSIYAGTRVPFELVYLDVRSPRAVRRELERESRRRGFRLLRSEVCLSPNEARNAALREVGTEYVAFVDNDVLVYPGWLEALLRCADETGAWAVHPLYLTGGPLSRMVHMAGGRCRIEEEKGKRRLNTTMRFDGRQVKEIRSELRREAGEHTEFHAVLVRRSVFDEIGPFDEALLGANDHLDFSLMLRARGGEIWFEPEAVVNYVTPADWIWGERTYYLLRWSEDWHRRSLQAFAAKWRLPPEDLFLQMQRQWLVQHRRQAFGGIWRGLARVTGGRAAAGAVVLMEKFMGATFVRAARARRRRRLQDGAPRFHAPAPGPGGS